MAHVSPAFDQDSFRGRNDDGSEAAATWIAASNLNWTQNTDENFRVRFLLQETAGGSADDVQPQLQYNLNAAGWNDVNAASAVARSSPSGHFAEDADTTQQIGAGTFITPNSGMDEDEGRAGELNDIDFTGNDEVEVEFCLQIRAADVADSDTVELRLIQAGVALDTYTNTPALTVNIPPVNVTVAAPPAAATAGANPPTVAVGATVAAAAAAGAAEALLPTVTAVGNVLVAVPVATAPAGASLPTVAVGATVAAAAAAGAAEALAPAVTAIRNVFVASASAEAPAVALLPTVTTTRFVTVPALVTEATAGAPPPTVAVGATVAAAAAAGAAEALAPAVTAIRNVFVASASAEAPAVALLPTVTTTRFVTVPALVTEATAGAPPPTVAVGATVAAAAAAGAAEALLPAVTAIRNVSVAGTPAGAPAAAILPTITTTRFVTVPADLAEASGEALLAIARITITLSAALAGASAAAPLPTIQTATTILAAPAVRNVAAAAATAAAAGALPPPSLSVLAAPPPPSPPRPVIDDEVVLFHRSSGQAILAVRPFTALEWVRRFRGSGTFRVELPLDIRRDIAAGDVLDIELAGRTDFIGIVQRRTISFAPARPPGWRLEGMDLTWWLHQRVIVPAGGASHDEQINVVAEDAIRHYIDTHLLNPADPARAIPVPALLEPAHSPRLGAPVTVRARYTSLARQVESIAALADLGYAADRDEAGRLLFRVLAPRDRTATSANPVIFSPNLGTAEVMTFTEAAVGSRNAIYVLGAGSGAGRLVEQVLDTGDIALRFRRELTVDARDATTAAAAQDAGAAELARQAAVRLRLEAQPPLLSTQRYRTHWDVGDLVTLDLPDLDLRLAQRIEAVRCQVDSEEPLRITCSFGAPTPDATTTLRRLDERTAPGRFQ